MLNNKSICKEDIVAEEIEMKLAVPSEVDLDEVRAVCSFLSGDGGNHIKMKARYFDTEDGAMQAARLAYRTRSENGRWVATLKGSGSSEGGLHRRMEIECDVTDGEVNLAVFDDTEAEELLLPYRDAKLVPIVETNFTRTVWILRDATAQIEIALDEGEILAGGKTEPIRELELEFKSGDMEALQSLSGWLQKQLGVVEENQSKFARGLALRCG